MTGTWWHQGAFPGGPKPCPPPSSAPPGWWQKGGGSRESVKQNDGTDKKPSCRRCKNAMGSKAADRAESINRSSEMFMALQDAQGREKTD